MAPVKLLLVGIFLCVFTFSKIVHSETEEMALSENKLISFMQQNSKWYIVARSDKPTYGSMNLGYASLTCTSKILELYKSYANLYLMIDSDKYNCDQTKVLEWKCRYVSRPNRNGVDRMNELVTIRYYTMADIVDITRESKDCNERIATAKSSRRLSWPKEGFGESTTYADTNC